MGCAAWALLQGKRKDIPVLSIVPCTVTGGVLSVPLQKVEDCPQEEALEQAVNLGP